MTTISKSMVRGFKLNFFKSVYRVINRDVERVCIIISVGNSGNNTKTFSVDFDKSSAQSLSRSSDKGEVKTILLACLIHSLSHVTNDLKT